MLRAGAAIEVQVFLDLRFAPPLRRLVDGKLDAPAAVLHHFGHERGIFGADGSIVEVDQLRKAHHALVKADPLVHLAQLDIAHDVINGGKIGWPGAPWHIGGEGAIAGQEDTFIGVSFDESMDGIAIRRYRREFDGTVIVFQAGRLHYAVGAAFGRFAVSPFRVIYTERDHFDAIAVEFDMFRHRSFWSKRRCDNQAYIALFEHVAAVVTHTRFQPGIGNWRKAPGVAEVIC